MKNFHILLFEIIWLDVFCLFVVVFLRKFMNIIKVYSRINKIEILNTSSPTKWYCHLNCTIGDKRKHLNKLLHQTFYYLPFVIFISGISQIRSYLLVFCLSNEFQLVMIHVNIFVLFNFFVNYILVGLCIFVPTNSSTSIFIV